MPGTLRVMRSGSGVCVVHEQATSIYVDMPLMPSWSHHLASCAKEGSWGELVLRRRTVTGDRERTRSVYVRAAACTDDERKPAAAIYRLQNEMSKEWHVCGMWVMTGARLW